MEGIYRCTFYLLAVQNAINHNPGINLNKNNFRYVSIQILGDETRRSNRLTLCEVSVYKD